MADLNLCLTEQKANPNDLVDGQEQQTRALSKRLRIMSPVV